MITNAKQLTYLNAMGIDVWQQKDQCLTNEPSPNYLSIDFAQLCQQPFFTDLLKSLTITLDEVTLNNNNCINLGLFNWQFSDTKQSQYQNNTLITPSMEVLTQQPKLKRELWQLLSNALI